MRRVCVKEANTISQMEKVEEMEEAEMGKSPQVKGKPGFESPGSLLPIGNSTFRGLKPII